VFWNGASSWLEKGVWLLVMIPMGTPHDEKRGSDYWWWFPWGLLMTRKGGLTTGDHSHGASSWREKGVWLLVMIPMGTPNDEKMGSDYWWWFPWGLLMTRKGGLTTGDHSPPKGEWLLHLTPSTSWLDSTKLVGLSSHPFTIFIHTIYIYTHIGYIYIQGERGVVVGWDTMLQAGRTLV
jgi:hypothetical protein